MDDKESIVKTRKYYPIVYGTLSFIGPFTILIFNKDFSRRVRLMLLGQERSIADILSLFFYSVHRLAFLLIPDSLFNHPVLPIASVYYNGLYWAIIIRSNGVALMTLHRFLSIVKPSLKITTFIQNAKPWKIWIFYWIPSLVFSFLFFSDSEIEFESSETMVLVMSSEIISKATQISFLYILFSCVFCIVSYRFIIRFIRKKSISVSKSQRREIRLAVQVFLYFIAQLILLIYLFLLSITALDDNVKN
ncbi:hypothetical protein CAEBREN_30131 [Caenorhabditis brenneri]|uniref:G-protein coupled receptors family 1 profile domain-containing protein n=1 Tax=Caenorhabditis brenneri TaxID=135651 RepID=G0NVY5_CAEBE|nr:hypothetical protein CAEBREN_30131 [Caenorhabditis brenneri]